MSAISLCIIVRDEETVLRRCLDSVKDAVDEIVIVDTGSEDSTIKIAREYTDRVYELEWKDDFSEARNFAFSMAEKEYLMWMDADDVISEENREKLIALKQQMPEDTDVVMMPYAVLFDEEGRCLFRYYRERIVRNHRGFAFTGKVHEVIPPSGRILYRDITIEHRKIKPGNSLRNLKIYEKMEKEGIHFDSRALYYYGRELTAHGFYQKGAEVLQRFLERKDGWLENRIDATRQLAVCRFRSGEEQTAVEALFSAFLYDVPRGETCCELGRYFMEHNRYEQAVFWYKQALHAKKDPKSGAFIAEDCYGFLPAISLCVCYERLGEIRMAERYNNLAGKFKPDSPYFIRNRRYFDYLKNKQNKEYNIQ